MHKIHLKNGLDFLRRIQMTREEFDRQFLTNGIRFLAGVDEAGRRGVCGSGYFAAQILYGGN